LLRLLCPSGRAFAIKSVLEVVLGTNILGKGLADFKLATSTAFKSRREMEEYARTDGVEWKLTHGFFVLSQTRAMRSDDTRTLRKE
jgi:hypothetical protein